MSAAASSGLPTLGPAESRTARRALSVLGVLGTASMLGAASSLYLVNHAPLFLIAISPIGRHLVLVAPTVDPVAFVVIAVVRRMLFYLASFYVGHALGELGIAWLEVRAAWMARFVHWVKSLYARAPRLVVFAMPGPTVSALAGIHRMPLRVFAGLATAGLTVRMLVILAFGEWMRGPIERILVFIDAYWVPGTAAIVLAIAVQRWVHWRRRSAALRRSAQSAGAS